MRAWKTWSEEELRNVKLVRDSGKPLKTQMHHFPGRSQFGVEHQMRKLAKEEGRRKLDTVSWVWGAAYQMLTKRPGLTAQDIASDVGCSYRHATRVLYDNHASEEKCVYISGWEKHGVNQIPQWTIGDEPDAPKLPLQTHVEYRRKERLRRQQKRIKCGRINPFAAALGLVEAPKGEPGRVYRHLTDEKCDELEAA